MSSPSPETTICPLCKGAKSLPVPPGSKLQLHGWMAIQCPRCDATGRVFK